MGSLFNYDNPIMSGLNKCFDCIILSVFWVIFSIPIFTIGASTTALYYTVNKVIRHNRSHVWREFWGSFKSNFKQSTAILGILFVLFIIALVDFMFMRNGAPSALQPLSIIFLAMINILLIWSVYLFTYIARFSCSTKVALKNSFFIFVLNLLWSILIWIISMASLLLLYCSLLIIPLVIFILPTVSMLLLNLILERIFKKYMTPEDLAAENARNEKQYD